MSLDHIHCVLLILFFHNIHASYVLSKDFFIGYKAGEFSIFKSNTPTLLYRIESDYALGQKIKLVKQSTKEVVATLRGEWRTSLYRVQFSIMNSTTKEWSNGTMKRLADKQPRQYIIKWNASIIWMRNHMNSSTTFQDEDENILLATFRTIKSSFTESKRYKLRIFSKIIPEPIFFLALAVEDAARVPSGRG